MNECLFQKKIIVIYKRAISKLYEQCSQYSGNKKVYLCVSVHQKVFVSDHNEVLSAFNNYKGDCFTFLCFHSLKMINPLVQKFIQYLSKTLNKKWQHPLKSGCRIDVSGVDFMKIRNLYRRLPRKYDLQGS